MDVSDQRARLVLDAPISEAAQGLLTPVMAKEIAEEIRAVYQNALIAKGIGTRYEGNSSEARIHLHAGSPCGMCRDHTLDGKTSY